MMTCTVRKFGVGVASLALVAGVAMPAMAADVYLPNGTKVDRLAGDERTETSVKVAEKRMHDAPVTTAYIVGNNAVVDAAAAGALTDGVILVAPRDKAGQLLLGKTMADSAQLKNINKLVAVGGKTVVSDEAMENIKKFNEGIATTDRIDGETRYQTAVNIAKREFKTSTPSNIYLARGDNPVDALAAGAIMHGPVLLVNPAGNVDESVVKYYKSSGKTADDVIVLGGEQALSDGQVQQIVGQGQTVSPWEFAASEVELRKAIQKAAVLYFGNDAFQKQATILQPDPNKGPVSFFGYGSGTSINNPTLQDPRKATTDELAAGDGAKAFTGYKTTYDILHRNVVGINSAYNVKKAELDAELAKAIAATNTKINGGSTKGTNATVPALNNLNAKFEAVYGVAAVAATATVSKDDGNNNPLEYQVTNAAQASYTYNAKGELTGLNQALINKINKESTDKAGTAEVAEINGGTAYAASTVPEGVEGSLNAVIADKTAKGGDAVDKTGKINWFVLNDLANKQEKIQKDLMDSAKADLDAAVAKYLTRPWEKVVTQAKGVKRIIGSDRFETSALISYYATTRTGTPTNEIYLASGNDVNLIDSVVSGQLSEGSIMLVPANGELTEQNKLELKRLATVNATIDGFVIGGPKAVSDEAVKAVAVAMK